MWTSSFFVESFDVFSTECGSASFPRRSFYCGRRRDCAAFLRSSFSLRPPLSKLPKQVFDHSSFSFLFFVHDYRLNHRVQFGSLFALSLQLLFHVFVSFRSQWFPLRPFLQRFLSTFLVAERRPTYRSNSDRRHPWLAVAIGILVFRTILCPATSLASRSRHVLRLLLSFKLSTIFSFLGEEHEEERDTQCMFSELKEAVSSDGSSHSSLQSSLSSSSSKCKISGPPPISHPPNSFFMSQLLFVLYKTPAMAVNMHDLGVCIPQRVSRSRTQSPSLQDPSTCLVHCSVARSLHAVSTFVECALRQRARQM